MNQERIETLECEKYYKFYQLVNNIIEGIMNNLDFNSKLDEFESVDIITENVNIITILTVLSVNKKKFCIVF